MQKTATSKRLSFMLMVFLSIAMVFTFLNVQTTARADGTTQIVASTQTTQWQYRDDNQTPANGWKTSEKVTDTAWKTGKGSFGAKNGTISDLGSGYIPNTLLKQYVDSSSTDVPVYYFRTTFDAQDVAAVKSITGTVVYDDAATVYINGVKVAGFNDSSFDTSGYGGSNAGTPIADKFSYTDISKLNLKASGNVLAVELHNGRALSSDIYLDVQNITLNASTPSKDTDVKTAEIKDLSLDIGSSQTKRNANWLATSDKDEYLEVAEKPANYKTSDAFPEQSATKVKATKTQTVIKNFYSCKAGIDNLKEKTTYVYRVGNEDKWSDTYTFTTQDFGIGTSFSFLFAGDPQIGASGDAGSDTTNWQKSLACAMKAFPNTDFLYSAGDQINNRTVDSQYDGYFTPDTLRQIPMAVNVGNHDNGDQRYTDFYNMPNVSKQGVTDGTGSQSGDYWFTYNGTLFMSLNSNNTSTAEHKAFMQEAMKANPDAVWNVVTFHHSTYSVANHYTDSDIIQRRKDLSPVFSELGIDVVLMGHDHYYTRTYMMDGSNPVVPKGHDVSKGESAPSSVTNPKKGQVLYLTANSASGSKYYSLNGSITQNGMPNYVAVQDQSKRTTLTNVTVTKNTFTVDTYYTDGTTPEKMDSFTIRRTEKPTLTVDAADTTLTVGQAYNPMTGVSAKDCDDKDLTDQVFVTVYRLDGQKKEKVDYVDTSKAGIYEIDYSVEDSYGKTATAKRTVTVKAKGSTANNNQNNKSTSQNGKAGTSAKASVKGSKGARTGDNTLPVTLFACIMCAAGASLVLMLRKTDVFKK
jgi:predicted phosphodiesterase